ARVRMLWGHHTNMDRLYECWLRVDEPARLPSDSAHLNMQFTFVDADGSTPQRRVGDMLRLSQLGYSYAEGGGCPAVAMASATGGGTGVTASASGQDLMIAGSTRLQRGVTTVPISVPPTAREMLSARAPSGGRRVYIVIEGLKYDHEKLPGALYNVYLKGDGDRRQLIGIISFFNPPHHDSGRFTFDATDAMQQLA